MARQCFTAEEAIEQLISGAEEEESINQLYADDDFSSMDSLSASDLTSESENEEDGVSTTHCPRKATSLPSRPVHDLDSALNINNYSILPLASEPKCYSAILDRPASKRAAPTFITWKSERPLSSGRQPLHNVILGNPGPSQESQLKTDSRGVWELFFTSVMLEMVVTATNNRIRNARKSFDASTSRSTFTFTNDTDNTETSAFLGLMYVRGLTGMNDKNVQVLYDPIVGPPVFGATMSKNRFQFLNSCISFDNQETRNERWKSDRFAAIRELFEKFNYNCSKHVVPDDYLSIDETLYPMRTKIGFKQFNPSKPAKYGLLFKSVNAVRYSYTFIAAPYCGKPVEDPMPYYVSGTENIVKYLIEKLQGQVDLQGRNISFDRLYTSISLANWLLSHNITCVGTLQANRRGLPVELKTCGNREVYSYECFWEEQEKKIVLHSYIVKTKSKGMRNVLLLSTVQPLLGVTKDDKKKPAIYKLYDFTKGGTDVMDQRMGNNTVKTKSKRWTIPAFSYILDTCRINASTVFAMNNGKDPRKQNSFEFGMDLAMSLIKPQIQRRSLNGLQMAVRHKINLVMGITCGIQADSSASNDTLLKRFPLKAESRKRCGMCCTEAAGPGQKKRKNSMSKIKTSCENCGKPSCNRHAINACIACCSKLAENQQDRQ